MTQIRTDALEGWHAGQASRARDRVDFADYWLGLWGSAVLIAMLLYLLIGTEPYIHIAVLDPETGVAPVSPLNRIFWIALLAFAAPIFWFRRLMLVESARRVWPLILMMVWFTATTRWAIDPGVSAKRLFLYLMVMLICVAISLAVRVGHRLHAAMASACAIMVGIDFFSWILLYDKSITDLGLAGIHTHKNTLGSVMMFCSLVCGTYLVSQKTWPQRLFWIGVLAAAFALLVASKSKTSLAILVVAALAAPLLVWVLGQRAKVIWALLACAGALGGTVMLAWLAWCAAQGLDPLSPLSGVTFTMRTDVWKFSLSQVALRPWSGAGFGSFWDIDPAVQPSLQTDEWFAKPDAYTNESHNGYIDLAVTTGVFGLIGSLALLLRWMSRSLLLVRQALFAQTTVEREALPYGLYLAIFPLLFFVHNFMESSFFTANATFGVLILLIGIDLDLRWPERARIGGISAPEFSPGKSPTTASRS